MSSGVPAAGDRDGPHRGGASIRVEAHIGAPPEQVWADVRDVASHTSWMEDAVAIRFRSASREGVGTAFDCDTRVGPLRLTDVMTITEWQPPERMGIRHEGIVTGAGCFRIEPLPGGRSSFVWEERLTFPWWMGGSLGARMAAPVLARIWRRNLANLKGRIEGTGIAFH